MLVEEVIEQYFTEITEENISSSAAKVLPVKENREMIIKFKVAHADVPTSNRRIYPREILKREVESISKRIQEGRVFGNDQHPRSKISKDGRNKLFLEKIDQPDFASTAVIPIDIEMNESGEVFSTVVVPKTDSGRNLAAIVRAGGRPGVSTRGYGTVKSVKKEVNGKQEEFYELQEDFHLATFDPVLDPSLKDAGILSISESEEKEIIPENMDPLEQWKKDNKEAYESLVSVIEKADYNGLKSHLPALHAVSYNTILEKVESETQEKLLTKYDEFLEEQEPELETAKNEGIEEGVSQTLEKLGLDKSVLESEDSIKEFKEKLNKKSEEPKEVQESNDSAQVPAPVGMTEEKIKELFKSQINEAISPISKKLKDTEAKLEESEKRAHRLELDNHVNECAKRWIYKSEVFEKSVRPLLEACDSVEHIDEVFESQLEIIKELGAKPVNQKSVTEKFLEKPEIINDVDSAEEGEQQPLSEADKIIQESEKMLGHVS